MRADAATSLPFNFVYTCGIEFLHEVIFFSSVMTIHGLLDHHLLMAKWGWALMRWPIHKAKDVSHNSHILNKRYCYGCPNPQSIVKSLLTSHLKEECDSHEI